MLNANGSFASPVLWVRAGGGGRLRSATQLWLCHNAASRCLFRPSTILNVRWSGNMANLPTPREPLHSSLPPSFPSLPCSGTVCGAAVLLSACCLAVVDTLDTSIRKTPRGLTLLRNGIDVGRKVNGDVKTSRVTSHFSCRLCYVVRWWHVNLMRADVIWYHFK